jgi:hypothetical protein
MIMNEIKKFEYEGNEITFLTGKNTLINATEMAKQFDVQPAFWLRTDQAKRMIEALSVMHNCIPTDLVQIRQGGNNKTAQGTWMHEDVALIFAQWLSPEFYIWCNDRIKELFKYGITAAEKKAKEIVFKLSEATSRLKENSACNIGRYRIYEQLRSKGILDENNKPAREYIDKGYFGYESYGKHSLAKYPIVKEEGLKWLTQLLFPELTSSSEYEELKQRINDMQHDQVIILEGLTAVADTLLVAKGGHVTEE